MRLFSKTESYLAPKNMQYWMQAPASQASIFIFGVWRGRCESAGMRDWKSVHMAGLCSFPISAFGGCGDVAGTTVDGRRGLLIIWAGAAVLVRTCLKDQLQSGNPTNSLPQLKPNLKTIDRQCTGDVCVALLLAGALFGCKGTVHAQSAPFIGVTASSFSHPPLST